MGAVLLVIIGILALAFIILSILLGMTLTTNQKLSAQSLYLPFTAKIDPKTGKSTGFKTSTGKPQLSCPVGKKINVVGAFFDIFDPYTECTTSINNVDPHFAFLCNPNQSGPTACSSDKECPAWTQGSNNPFTCNIPKGESTGFCKLNNIGVGQSCPGKGSGYNFQNIGGYCIDANMCGTNIVSPSGSSMKPGVPNPYCTPSNSKSQCAMRDASATVAAKCNGQQECSDISVKDFGDLPCLGTHMEPKSCLTTSSTGGVAFIDGKRDGYCGLPFMPGYPGGLPPNSASGSTSEPANGNVGYTMHGIYTCVDE